MRGHEVSLVAKYFGEPSQRTRPEQAHYRDATHWEVALNTGLPGTYAPGSDWHSELHPGELPDPVQPQLGTPLDYNHDGRMDMLLYDVYGQSSNWMILLAGPGNDFTLHDSGIIRPYPGGAPPPNLLSPAAGIHLADVNGDGMTDLLQCDIQNALQCPRWKLHLWSNENAGAAQGFAPVGRIIPELDAYNCDVAVHMADLDGDTRTELIVQHRTVDFASCEANVGTEYIALTLESVDFGPSSVWKETKTGLTASPNSHVVFLDVNGDGLPDALQKGVSDDQLLLFINRGDLFALAGDAFTTGIVAVTDLDFSFTAAKFLRLAAPLDFNADGRQDLLIPLSLGGQNAVPFWAILQATGNIDGSPGSSPFHIVPSGIPFSAELTAAGIALASPHGPRVK
jgi:hypothetical protein